MSKAAHTPLPWNKNEFNGIDDAHGFGLFDGHDILVLHKWEDTGANHWNEKPGETYREISDEEAAANSELVFLAVNNHQELLTRLYNLVNAVDCLGGIGEPGVTYTVNDAWAKIDFAMTEARELIKKLTP